MKKRLSMAFILVFLLSACISSKANTTPKPGVQLPLDNTRENSAVQTIIALEEMTKTPTPTPVVFSNLPKPWAEIGTPSPTPNSTQTGSAMATALSPNSIIYQGPGLKYKMACYVARGTQLIITGRDQDANWLSVVLAPEQTCITMVGNVISADLVRDPSMQFWILQSSYAITGDLSSFPIITPAPTWSYYPGIVGSPTVEIPPPRD